MFPIDLFPGDEEQELFEEIIEDMRDNIQKQVQERDYFDVPITWFIFLLKIQKLCQLRKISYISYQEAVDVWMDQKVSEKEMTATPDEDKCGVQDALLFFHFMGMIFYYHKIEEMRDFIFVDCQWLFDKLTELVEIKFTKSYNKKGICAEDVEAFTMEGRLNINIIKNLKVNLQGIPPLCFIRLWNHLNIVLQLI